MADDLGVECLGSYGGVSYQTPHLDRLAAAGMRFTHAYAQPLCTNTRLQLMTGLYNHRNWIAFGILDPRAKTLGHWASEAGYRTLIAGKWQLQSYDPPDYPGAEGRRGIGMRAENAGFDEYCLWHTGHTERKGSRYADPVLLHDGKFRPDTKGRYGPDIWVETITDFMRRHRDRPFFVYYPMALPHWPFMPTPRSKEWQDPVARHVEDLKHFPAMVEYTDLVVGRLVAAVDELGLGERTLILFYSDNGTHRKIVSQTKTGPVHGGKGLTTDAGTHVPLIARWTGKIAAGSLSQELVDSTDFVPTLWEATGWTPELSRRTAPRKLDGVSFYPQLLGRRGEPRRWTYCHFDPRPGWDKDKFRLLQYVRDKRYKLYADGRMYDIAHDPLEQRPLAREAHPAIRQRLAEQLAEVSR